MVILLMFLFSNHIHTIANIDIRGKEAIKAPNPGFLLANSEMITISTPEIIALIMSNNIY